MRGSPAESSAGGLRTRLARIALQMAQMPMPRIVETERLVNDLLTMTRVVNELNKALDMMHDAMFGLEELMGQHPDDRLQEVRSALIQSIDFYKARQTDMRNDLLRNCPHMAGVHNP